MMTQTIKQGWRGLNQTRKSHCILTYGHDDLDLSIFFVKMMPYMILGQLEVLHKNTVVPEIRGPQVDFVFIQANG